MIEHQLVLIIALILAICLLIMVSQRVKVAYPIMLVLGGVAMSFIPGMPRFNINPDLIFLVFLPPILYEAAYYNSWKELWRWRRIIGSFAFIVVFITALVVGFIANTFIPGFSVALGFLLGGIVSPPRCRVGSHHYEICKGAKAYIGHSGRREFVQRCQFAHYR